MWSLWQGFVSLLEQALLYLSLWSGTVGLGIVLFTIVARIVILPLTLRSLQSSRKMQELQPQLKELQRKYGKDREKLTQETMELYKRSKVNPAGGCLPLLLQLPIFFGVYQAVINLTNPALHVNLRPEVAELVARPDVAAVLNAPLFGVLNLGLAAWVVEPVPPGATVGFQGWQYLILPVLSLVFQLVQQVMAMPRVMDPQQKAMMQAMLIMPIVFGYFAFTFPSGAVLYWVTSSVLGIIQQYLITGWGSLSNYLPFLSTETPRWSPLAAPTPAVVPMGSTASGEAALPTRTTFWEVLQPLTQVSEAEVEANEPIAEATAETPRRVTVANPRRPRRRR
jgi:YidC/Oxa1 family membrane protein insertase